MRGEHRPESPSSAEVCGSSPHARGTLFRHLTEGMDERFIPACAGNTVSQRPANSCMSVHPRMRGEHFTSTYHCFSKYGSSPHARGTRERCAEQGRPMRFIPACAGNTGIPHSRPPRQSVHPRMRGEHRHHPQVIPAVVGSSPHARGTLPRRCPARGYCRFIPACAGNTIAAGLSRPVRPVHPRMRGEHTVVPTVKYLGVGSSPHARGTQPVMLFRVFQRRFIPACAGNTLANFHVWTVHTVHPRMRGEHSRSTLFG